MAWILLGERMQFDSRLKELLGLGTLKSANHRAGTTINQSDLWICWVSLATSPLQQTQPLILSKLPLCGSKGLTIFAYIVTILSRLKRMDCAEIKKVE